MNYTIIKKCKSLELIKLNKEISGGFYVIRCNKEKKAKTGLCLSAVLEIFDNCML